MKKSMAKHCIACKREIAKGQQECYICGSSQSYLRFYLKGVVFLFLLLGALGWVGYGYINQMAQQAEAEKAIQIESNMQVAAKKIEELESLLVRANQHIQKVEVNTVQSSEAADEEKLKLEDAEKRAKKAEERAGWLSRENRRFKAKVEELTEQLSSAKNATKISDPPPSAINPQLDTLKQELAGYESQRQTLVNNIASEKSQLEASWQVASGSDAVPPSADIIARRAQQVEQATASKTSQVLVLNGQIDVVRKKISVLEGGL